MRFPQTHTIWAAVAAVGLVLSSCGSDTGTAEVANADPDAAASEASIATTEPIATATPEVAQTTADEPEIESEDTDAEQMTSDEAGADKAVDGAASEAADGGATDEAAASAATDDSAEADDGATNTSGASGAESSYLGDYTLIDESFGTQVTVSVAGDTRTIQTNALPNHETGAFPNSGNPNSISAQSLSWEFPITPSFTGSAVEAHITGVALNGIKFEPGTAERITCATGETHRIEALQQVYDLGFDFNNAHVQPTGEYHYHGISSMLVDAYDEGSDLVLIGFAADGHLIYYSNSNSYSPSYRLNDTARSGTDCSPSLRGANSIDLDGTIPDGTYDSDWVFDSSVGNLDECNGTTVDGTYVYLVTNEYPFVGRCLMGSFTQSRGPGAAPGGAPTDNGQTPGAGPEAGAAPGNGQPPDMSGAADALGISETELLDALGFPPDLQAAAATLGITVEQLQAVLPPPPQ